MRPVIRVMTSDDQKTELLLHDLPGAEPEALPQPLTETDAVEIWIARWLRIPRIQLIRRYRCDPRRLYEIWECKRFPESKARARREFSKRYPELGDRTDFGDHRRIPRFGRSSDQLSLFEDRASR